jgi:hypothetical protein
MENHPEPMLPGTDDRAVRCVGGLAKISRWTGVENLHWTDFLVATQIVAYNMFMNGVDRMDMTIFTFILDLSITQAYAIHQKKADEKKDSKVSFFKFKRRICQSLICGSQRCKRHSPSNTLADEEINELQTANHEGRVTIASSLGSMNEAHMLVENLPRKSNDYVIQDIDCFLCRRIGKELKMSYSCIQCRRDFT